MRQPGSNPRLAVALQCIPLALVAVAVPVSALATKTLSNPFDLGYVFGAIITVPLVAILAFGMSFAYFEDHLLGHRQIAISVVACVLAILLGVSLGFDALHWLISFLVASTIFATGLGYFYLGHRTRLLVAKLATFLVFLVLFPLCFVLSDLDATCFTTLDVPEPATTCNPSHGTPEVMAVFCIVPFIIFVVTVFLAVDAWRLAKARSRALP